jgi:hypothetical protein
MAVEDRTSTVEGAVEGAATETLAAAESTEALAVRYPVAPGVRLKVRSGPGTQYCQKPGEWVTGTYGTTNIWDNIANGQYVSDAYVNTGSDGYVAPRCA